MMEGSSIKQKSYLRGTAIVLACTVSGLTLSGLFWGCQQRNQVAPFFDGMYLSYEEISGKSSKPKDILWIREIHYRFQQRENGTFKIFQKIHTERGQGLNEDTALVAYPEVGDELMVDGQGTVLQGGDGINFIDGYPLYLWLPPKYRKEGAEVIPIARKVKDKTEWKGWEVWPVVFGDMSIKALYYDNETGILAGAESLNGKIKMKLKDTNLKELKATVSKETFNNAMV
jgi:hypothetical protein